MSMEKIQELRKRIDEIDDKLVELLNERARVVIEVGNIKKAKKLDFHSPSPGAGDPQAPHQPQQGALSPGYAARSLPGNTFILPFTGAAA